MSQVKEAVWHHHEMLYNTFDFYSALYSDSLGADGEWNVYSLSFNAYLAIAREAVRKCNRIALWRFPTDQPRHSLSSVDLRDVLLSLLGRSSHPRSSLPLCSNSSSRRCCISGVSPVYLLCASPRCLTPALPRFPAGPCCRKRF